MVGPGTGAMVGTGSLVAMPDTVLLAAGGTGGHVFPGLATAAALQAAEPGLDVVFVGTADRLEARLVPEAGHELHTVPAMAFRKDLSLLRLPLVLGRAVASVGRLIADRRVVAAVGFGGYTSVPLALAARRHRVPLVVHEQNAVAGRANRLAARGAAAVGVTFAEAAGAFGSRRTVVTGNPVRPGLLPGADTADLPAARRALREEAMATFGLDPDRRTLLVFGGSQGALRINRAVVDSIGRWADPGGMQVLHAAGTRTHAEVEAALADTDPAPLRLELRAFIDRMDLAYAAADLVVCRAGASSIAELTALGLPSVLVPYPHATDDHQTANARALAAAGGAVVIADHDLDAEALVTAAEPLLAADGAGRAMADAATDFGRPQAAHDLAALVLEVADR